MIKQMAKRRSLRNPKAYSPPASPCSSPRYVCIIGWALGYNIIMTYHYCPALWSCTKYFALWYLGPRLQLCSCSRASPLSVSQFSGRTLLDYWHGQVTHTFEACVSKIGGHAKILMWISLDHCRHALTSLKSQDKSLTESEKKGQPHTAPAIFIDDNEKKS